MVKARRARWRADRRRQSGVSFLVLLFAMALIGIALAGTGVLWQMERQREREKELLFSGEQYRRAITSYYSQTPGENKLYPQKLEDLLADKRFPIPVRHLRRLYREPMTQDGEWELIRDQGRIIGVASPSRETPIKVAGFAAGQDDFQSAASYRQWRFVSSGGNATPAAAAPTPATPTPATPGTAVPSPLTPSPATPISAALVPVN